MFKLQFCLIFLELLHENFSVGFHLHPRSCGFRSKYNRVVQLGTQDTQTDDGAIKKIIPQRRDTCKLLISGVIGTEPKEAYLSNNHYVINFALAVVGHFEPIHDWEKNKHAETMWINVEVWDDVAKTNARDFRKGSTLNGLGTLLILKWTDKDSGEERKQFKYRLLKVMTPAEMSLFESPVSSPISDSLTTVLSAADVNNDQQTDIKDVETVSTGDTNVKIGRQARQKDTAPVVSEGSLIDDRDRSVAKPQQRQKPVTRYGTYDPDAE